jgi:hypothetical protein
MTQREIYFQVCYETETIPDAVAVLPKKFTVLKEAKEALRNVKEFHDKPGANFFVRKTTTLTTHEKII